MRLFLKRFGKDGLWIPTLFPLLAFVAGSLAGAILEELLGGPVITNQLKALFVIMLFLGIIVTVLVQTYVMHLRLYEKIGIKVRYVENEDRGRVYRKCREVVDGAKQSICVVNSYLLEGHELHSKPEASELRAAYYSALLARALSGVEYTRIAQVRTDNSPLSEMDEDPLHRDHLAAMIRHRSGKIILLKAPADRPTTFVLIDKEHLIWQINRVTMDEGGKERLSLEGAFIIHDQHRRITEHFSDYFNELLSKNQGSIQTGELTTK